MSKNITKLVYKFMCVFCAHCVSLAVCFSKTSTAKQHTSHLKCYQSSHIRPQEELDLCLNAQNTFSYAVVYKLVYIFFYKSILCMHPLHPYKKLYIFSYLSLCYAMHASYAAVYKLVYIFLYRSMLCTHPMQSYINLYICFKL